MTFLDWPPVFTLPLLVDSITSDHIVQDVVHLPLRLAHRVINSPTLLGTFPRTVRAEISFADLDVLMFRHVLVVDGAALRELFVAPLFLMGLEPSDIGGVTSLLSLVVAGHHLRVVGVLLEHDFLVTSLPVPLDPVQIAMIWTFMI